MSDHGYMGEKTAVSIMVWIIGVDPPCPRCDLMRQRVERICKEIGGNFTFKYSVYSDSESKKFAMSIGKQTGTATHVAKQAGINVDSDHVRAIINTPPSHPEDFDEIRGKALKWSPELDEELRPCQEKAESLGMLITPILVVNGEVKHHGSVPSLKQSRRIGNDR